MAVCSLDVMRLIARAEEKRSCPDPDLEAACIEGEDADGWTEEL
jgi:hypothetical protein